MLRITKIQFSSLRRQFTQKPSMFFKKVRPCYATITISRDDDDENNDKMKSNENKDLNKTDAKQLEKIHRLNKLFYYNYTITYQDLKDLIVGTFKKLYNVQLEICEGQVCFVIYPDIKSEDDLDYKKKMEAISLILTDYAMKEYLYDEIKKINMIKKEPIVIPLKFDINK